MLIKAVIKRTKLEDLPSVISRYCKGTVNQQKPNAMAGRSKAGRSYTLEVCAWLFASALPPDQSPRATFSHVVLTADMREDAGSSLKTSRFGPGWPHSCSFCPGHGGSAPDRGAVGTGRAGHPGAPSLGAAPLCRGSRSRRSRCVPRAVSGLSWGRLMGWGAFALLLSR